MGVIAITGAVEPVYVEHCKIRTHVTAEKFAKGQAAHTVPASGKIGVADANAAGKEQFRGIVLDKREANQGVDVLHEGYLAGYDLSGLDYDALVYLSDTAGALDTAAGTKSVIAGRVVAMPDNPARTKVLYVEARLVAANW